MTLRRISILTATVVALSSCSREPETSTAPAPVPVPSAPLRDIPAEGRIDLQPLAKRPPLHAGATMFEEIAPEDSGVKFKPDFEPLLKDITQMRLNAGGGICTADFTGDGRCDFYVTSPAGDGKLYENRSDWKFRDITEAAGLKDSKHWGTGAQGVDVDGDGDNDLFVCGYRSPNRLWINDGKGHFTDRAEAWGLAVSRASMTMAWADTDGDGQLDGYLATSGFAPGPEGQFRVNMEPRADGKKVPVIPPELAEVWEMLYLPGDRARNVPAAHKDHLFRQENGRFTDITAAAGLTGPWFTLSAVWWDYDMDGLPDCYVSNDYTGPDRLWRNAGGNRFTNTLPDVIPHTPWFSMGADVGDLNNDGLIDLMSSDMAATSHYRDKVMMGNMDDSAWFLDWAEPRQFMRNALYINTGAGRVFEAAFMSGLAGTDWTWTPRMEDYDNDGWVDVFITNGVLRDMMNSDLTREADAKFKDAPAELAKFWRGQPMRKERNLAFRNAHDLKFEKCSAEWGLDHHGVTFGAATADFDNDGALDLVVSNLDGPVGLYRNRCDGNALEVRLKGTASNASGLGATVTAVTPEGLKLTRYVTVTRGFLSASDPLVHFGLGAEATVASLKVRWPSGCEQIFTDIAANQLATVTEGGTNRTSFNPPAKAPLFQPAETLAALKHEELPSDDFQREPLLPNKQSVYGPGMAWGDADGDGDDDIWLAGASGFPGQIALRAPDVPSVPPVPFVLSPQPALAADKQSEDMGGLWFDADGDSDHDLYVVSGGNECKPGDLELRDRLYLNDGKGGLTNAPAGTLPDERHSGSVVTGADFDRDGDMDLFTGGRQVPGQFPTAPPCALLINDAGKFSVTPLELGMVTSALWTDADGDGWLDLLVSVEWGCPRFLHNDNGKLTDQTEAAGLTPLTGWWNGLAAADFDHDGDMDYAITNFGLNTKYKASPSKPELLFASDFDGTGHKQIVEAKYEGDILRPRRGLSCSSAAMPFIRGKLPSFHSFASATLTEVYAPEKLESGQKLSVTELNSGVLFNDGDAKFRFQPLPRLAQVAPAFGVVAADITADGHPDIVITHNFFGPQRETGRMDGGMGLLLAGSGKGDFTPVWPAKSGIVVPQDARSLALADVNGDHAPDLVFGINNGPVRVFTRQPDKAFISIRLKGKKPVAGARVTLRSGNEPAQTAELSSAGSYLTAPPQELWFTAESGKAEVTVRWPDDDITRHEVSGPSAVIERK